MTRARLFLTLPLLFAAALVIVPGLSQEPQKQRVDHKRRAFDESRFPIADYSAEEPSDAQERAKRLGKGKKYDKSKWGVHPDAPSDTVVLLHSVDRTLPALPFDQSSAVVVGQIMDARAYLSNDKSGVYSVFTIQVNEVFKNSTKTPITGGSAIEVERDGGRVRFPNGRLHMYKIGSLDMPKTGLRYVLFLNDGESGYQILTGYELNDGKVYPLDDLPKLRAYENADELSFLSELRTKS
jgi:hypothetical protein